MFSAPEPAPFGQVFGVKAKASCQVESCKYYGKEVILDPLAVTDAGPANILCHPCSTIMTNVEYLSERYGPLD